MRRKRSPAGRQAPRAVGTRERERGAALQRPQCPILRETLHDRHTAHPPGGTSSRRRGRRRAKREAGPPCVAAVDVEAPARGPGGRLDGARASARRLSVARSCRSSPSRGRRPPRHPRPPHAAWRLRPARCSRPGGGRRAAAPGRRAQAQVDRKTASPASQAPAQVLDESLSAGRPRAIKRGTRPGCPV